METISYLLKVNLAIILFYGIYRVLFRQDTLFQWKRILLLGMVAVSFLYPLEHRNIVAEKVVFPTYSLPEIVVTPASVTQETSFSVWQWMEIIYVAGIVLLSLRLLIQFGVLIYKISKTRRRKLYGFTVHESQGLQTPFSFFGWIVLDPAHYTEHELKEILLHETTHVRQLHSIDTLLTEIVCVVCWFNPFAWWLKKEIRMNLEFLADRSVINSGCEAEHYQFHLLRLSYHKSIINVTNNFNFSPLKTRIIMMTKKQTSRTSLLKYGLLAPAIAALVLFNSSVKVAAQTVTETVTQTKTELAQAKTAVPGTKTAPVNVKGEVAQVTAKPAEVLTSHQVVVTEVPTETTVSTTTKLSEVVVVGLGGGDIKPNDVYDHVEQMPSFASSDGSGEKALYKWLADNLQYPAEAAQKGIQGRVIIRFIVTSNGSVKDVEVVRSVDALLDKEAIRIAYKMPNWVPGKQNGKAVNVYFTLPIQFKLAASDTPKKEATAAPESGLQIRGEKTNVAASNALIIVDGKEWFSGIESLKTEDIESINVLKNESATTIYGEKGKNGVILITTKKLPK